MLNTARAAKEIVRESASDGLAEFDRDIVGGNSVRIHIPLRDPVECSKHLEMIEETCRQIRFQLQHASRKDRSKLFLVRGMIRALHKKINAYRSGIGD